MTATADAAPRRRYDNTLRRERAAQTRDRIVESGADLLRGSSIRDWQGLTIRAVAQRAGVSDRTVFRHFANERALRDAVMQRLEAHAGIDLGQLRMESIGDVAARIFRLVSAHPLDPRPALDPTLADANRRQHEALLGAVEAHTQGWPVTDRTVAAAMFDVLWAVGSYERLVTEWPLAREDAIRGIEWVIGLLADALDEDRRPPAARAQFATPDAPRSRKVR